MPQLSKSRSHQNFPYIITLISLKLLAPLSFDFHRDYLLWAALSRQLTHKSSLRQLHQQVGIVVYCVYVAEK